VKTHDVETPAIVAERIREALAILPVDRLSVNPGLRPPPSSPRGRFPSSAPWWRGPSSSGASSRDDQPAARRAGRTVLLRVELVASALTREARLLEAASGLARIPAVVAGSVTSYAGGAMGHDPLRVAAAARARGLTPNIHLTCVSQDRRGLAKSLDDMPRALARERVCADRRLSRRRRSAARVRPRLRQLVRLIDERRRAACPFTSRWRSRPSSTPRPTACTSTSSSRRRSPPAPTWPSRSRLGRAEVRGAPALPRRARALHPAARQRCTFSGRRRRSGWRPVVAGLLGLARASRRRARGEPGEGWRAARPGSSARRGTVAVLRGLGYAGLPRRHHDAAHIG